MAHYLIGIDVGGTNIKYMVMDGEKRVVSKNSIPTYRNDGYEKVSDRLIEAIDRTLDENHIKKEEILSLAMGLPGTVDKKKGETVYLAALHWDGFNPAQKLGHYYDCAYEIDNDANVNALGEYAFGGHGQISDMVLLTLGTGVGCGVIANGEVLRGAGNLAAEAGHMIICADGGDLCLCGKYGHLEAYCSGSALAWEAKKMMDVTPDTILHRLVAENNGQYDNAFVSKGCEMGDVACLRLMERFTRYLSVGIANVMILYNPQLVLLGGGISNAGSMILDPVNQNCRNLVLNENSYCPVEKAALGSEAGMYGACALAGQKIGIGL